MLAKIKNACRNHPPSRLRAAFANSHARLRVCSGAQGKNQAPYCLALQRALCRIPPPRADERGRSTLETRCTGPPQAGPARRGEALPIDFPCYRQASRSQCNSFAMRLIRLAVDIRHRAEPSLRVAPYLKTPTSLRPLGRTFPVLTICFSMVKLFTLPVGVAAVWTSSSFSWRLILM